MKKAVITITKVKEKGYRNHYWFAYKDERGYYKYMVTFSVKNGIPILKNHSVGIEHSCYANIAGSGSVAGMRANYGWKKNTVVKAHGNYFNIDKCTLDNPIEAFLYLLKKKFDFNFTDFIDKEFTIEYSSEFDNQAAITTFKHIIENDTINKNQLSNL